MPLSAGAGGVNRGVGRERLQLGDMLGVYRRPLAAHRARVQ